MRYLMLLVVLGACGEPDPTEIAGTWRIEFDPAPCALDNIVRTFAIANGDGFDGDAEWLDAEGIDPTSSWELWDVEGTTWHVSMRNMSGITDIFVTPGETPIATAYWNDLGFDSCISPEVSADVEKVD